MTRLRAEELSPGSFAPFGRVVRRPAGAPDAAGPGWSWWAETALLGADDPSWGVGVLQLDPTDPRFDWAERHLRTEEAVLATSGDLALYVAPADDRDEPARDGFRAFRVPAGDGVVLGRGVWHGAPFALGRACRALVLIREGTGREDVTVVRFPESPLDIDAAQEGADEHV